MDGARFALRASLSGAKVAKSGCPLGRIGYKAGKSRVDQWRNARAYQKYGSEVEPLDPKRLV